jgi:hypothetical protein
MDYGGILGIDFTYLFPSFSLLTLLMVELNSGLQLIDSTEVSMKEAAQKLDK